MSRSSRYRGLLFLSLPVAAFAVAAAGITACGAFDASSDTPAGGDGASTEAASGDALVGSADGPIVDEAAADAPPPGTVCHGAFQTSRVIMLGTGIGGSLRSVRGTSSGTFVVSYDTSPDDNMATATLVGGMLGLSGVNPFDTLNGSTEETSPTATDDLNLVVFVSNRQVPDGGATTSLLWFTEFAGGSYGTPSYLPVAGVDPTAGAAIGSPYIVDNRIYFDVQNELRVGDVVKATKRVSSVNAVPGAGAGSHPVVTKDQRELFYQVGAGIQVATRGAILFSDTTLIPGSLMAYPTWISDDSCHLYAIRSTGAGQELVVFDREP